MADAEEQVKSHDENRVTKLQTIGDRKEKLKI